MNEWLDSAVKLATALGGIGVIAAGAGALVSKIMSDHLLESHKASLGQELERLKAQLGQEGDRLRLSLKKQELIFSKQLEAGTAFLKLYNEIYPRYSNPSMEWDDACSDVAGRFGSLVKPLEEFVLFHGPIVSKAVRNRIESCIGVATEHQFDSNHEGEYEKGTLDAAGTFLESLGKIKEDLLGEIRSWEATSRV